MKPLLLYSIKSLEENDIKNYVPIFKSNSELESSGVSLDDLINLHLVQDEFSVHTEDVSLHMTGDNETKLNTAYEHTFDDVIHITSEEKAVVSSLDRVLTKTENSIAEVDRNINLHTTNIGIHFGEGTLDKISELIDIKLVTISEQISTLISGITWKSPVETIADLATTYPEPKEGWTVYVTEEDSPYTYDEESNSDEGPHWFKNGGSLDSMKKANKTQDGLMSSVAYNDLYYIYDNYYNDAAWEEIRAYLKEKIYDASHPTDGSKIVNYVMVTEDERAIWNNKADDKAVDENGRGLMTPQMYGQLATLYNSYNNNSLYTHPVTHPATMIVQDSTHKFVTDDQIKNWNSTTPLATTTTSGLMSADAFNKLSNIESSANNYIHPITHSATMIEEDTTHRFVTDEQITNWNSAFNTVYSASQISTMSVDDATPDNDISDSGFIKILYDAYITNTLYDHPLTHPSTMIETDATHRFVTDDQIKRWDNKADSSIVSLTNNGMMSIDMLNKLNNTVSKDDVPIIPESLPADGGNSDTVGGYTATRLLAENKRSYVVIGHESYDSEDDCDFIYKETDKFKTILDSAINTISNGGEIRIKPGIYNIDEPINIKMSNTVINGVGGVVIKTTIAQEDNGLIASRLWDFSSDDFISFTNQYQTQSGLTINDLTFIKTASGVVTSTSPGMIDGIELESYVTINPKIGNTNTIELWAKDGHVLKIYVSSSNDSTISITDGDTIYSKPISSGYSCIEFDITSENLYKIYSEDSIVNIYRIHLVGNDKDLIYEDTDAGLLISGNNNTISNIEFDSTIISLNISGFNNTISNCTFNGIAGVALEGYSNIVDASRFYTSKLGVRLYSTNYNTNKNIIRHNYFSDIAVGVFVKKESTHNISKNYITNNIFCDLYTGIKISSGSQNITNNNINIIDKSNIIDNTIIIASTSQNNIIINNLLNKEVSMVTVNSNNNFIY